MLFGASYYHEYQPMERLEQDLDLMVEAGFTMIRVGESTWTSYEPVEGQIDFSALLRVVQAASDRGLKVIVGTPTYAIPSWMATQYPEVMAKDSAVHVLPYGGRQNVDFTHPTFRYFAQRIITQMVDTFQGIPGVIGFQVDNEIGSHSLTNPHLLDRFRKHAVERLGGIDALNEKWGLTYWSHRVTEPAELWAPDGNSNPGYALEWDRFQRHLTDEFLQWQRDLIRPRIRDDQFINHDAVSGYGSRTTAMVDIAQSLDHTAINLYVPLQEGFALPERPTDDVIRLSPHWSMDAGVWSALWRSDMAYSLRGPRGESFSVPEAQVGTIGGPEKNIPPYPGQLRLFAHLLLARGGDLLAYWHWHSLHYGGETFWGGVLGHDLQPGRLYREVAELGAELKALPEELEGLVPDSDIAYLFSADSRNALQFMPMFVKDDGFTRDTAGYHRVFERVYRAGLDAGAQARIVHEHSDWSGESVLVVPALYIADDALLDRIRAHAEAGAHVILTFRSGYADEWARVRWVPQPATFRDVLGAQYQEFTSILDEVPLTAGPAWQGTVPDRASATAWADLLVADDDQDVLLGYEDPFLKDYAAAVTRSVGQGRITWLGSLIDPATATEVIRWALQERGSVLAKAAWTIPATVRVSSARLKNGSRAWFLANHSWESVSVDLPAGVRITTLEADEAVHEPVRLNAWDARILLER